ncbi:MAG: ABC transporter permease [Halobacteriales archaeon]|nr:ABC transporter permease [Halobacteriales archaeon]
MSRARRLRAEVVAEGRSFLRRRTAVFFTFLFPVILVLIFGALVGTSSSAGLFAEPPAYYVPGYLAVVVLFTPLSRVSSTVARHREGRRFEKLATTPLSAAEWLAAHAVVNVGLVFAAGALVLGLVALLTDARFTLSPLLVPFVALGTTVFVGAGALIGRLSDSQDGAIAASNAIGLPLLFLSETFVPPSLLPAWFRPVTALSPLTYFARGTRDAVTAGTGWAPELAVLAVLALAALGIGAWAVPWRT